MNIKTRSKRITLNESENKKSKIKSENGISAFLKYHFSSDLKQICSESFIQQIIVNMSLSGIDCRRKKKTLSSDDLSWTELAMLSRFSVEVLLFTWSHKKLNKPYIIFLGLEVSRGEWGKIYSSGFCSRKRFIKIAKCFQTTNMVRMIPVECTQLKSVKRSDAWDLLRKFPL